MTRSRREFCRALGSLACVGLGGCKIEPILALESEQLGVPLAFPDLPPKIPDQLADAETTLRMLTEQLLAREESVLTSGELRERPSEDDLTVPHLVELLRRCGLGPAGNGGGWLQAVMLEVVEPTGEPTKIQLRPEVEPTLERTLDLGPLGAFRQRGAASPRTALSLGQVFDHQTPLVPDELAGRVALFRVPDDLDLDDPSARTQIDALLSSVRDAGALGCLLLTNDEGPGIDRYRALWQRQVRRPLPTEGSEQAMLIEGLIGKAGQAAILDALRDARAWVLDVDLATQSYQVESHNVLGSVLGRDPLADAVILTCAWDTPDPLTLEADTRRLLTSIATFFQLAEWSRRSTRPKHSLILLLTVDAGLAAGTTVHASAAVTTGTQAKAVLALDRPTRELLPAVVLAGHYDGATAELVRRVVSADGRDLLLVDQLGMPSLAPYLRDPSPVMTIGAPDPEALALPAPSTSSTPDPSAQDPLAGLFADVRLLRNLLLALAN